MASLVPRKSIRFIIGTTLILVFFIAVFAAAMAVYTKVELGSVTMQTYAQAWEILFAHMR